LSRDKAGHRRDVGRHLGSDLARAVPRRVKRETCASRGRACVWGTRWPIDQPLFVFRKSGFRFVSRKKSSFGGQAARGTSTTRRRDGVRRQGGTTSFAPARGASRGGLDGDGDVVAFEDEGAGPARGVGVSGHDHCWAESGAGVPSRYAPHGGAALDVGRRDGGTAKCCEAKPDAFARVVWFGILHTQRIGAR